MKRTIEQKTAEGILWVLSACMLVAGFYYIYCGIEYLIN